MWGGVITRLKIIFTPKESFLYRETNPYFLHSFIWSRLKGTELEKLHDQSWFKFFTFSNIFPIRDFKESQEKWFFVSSPSKFFIETLKEKLEEKPEFRIGQHKCLVNKVKKFNLQISKVYESVTPIVIYKDNKRNLYFSFKRDNDLNFFIERLKENAIKKYKAYYNIEEFEIEDPLFDAVKIKRTTATKIRKNNREFVIIGTQAMFKLFYYRKGKSRFYRFVMETGLGEKNSFGFGFVNPVREANC